MITIPATQGTLCTIYDVDYMGDRFNAPRCRRNVDKRKKRSVYLRYKQKKSGSFIVDHIIPLGIGGNNDIDNLWPQHKSVSSTKLEYETFKKVKYGEINIFEARNIIHNFKFAN